MRGEKGQGCPVHSAILLASEAFSASRPGECGRECEGLGGVRMSVRGWVGEGKCADECERVGGCDDECEGVGVRIRESECV